MTKDLDREQKALLAGILEHSDDDARLVNSLAVAASNRLLAVGRAVPGARKRPWRGFVDLFFGAGVLLVSSVA